MRCGQVLACQHTVASRGKEASSWADSLCEQLEQSRISPLEAEPLKAVPICDRSPVCIVSEIGAPLAPDDWDGLIAMVYWLHAACQSPRGRTIGGARNAHAWNKGTFRLASVGGMTTIA